MYLPENGVVDPVIWGILYTRLIETLARMHSRVVASRMALHLVCEALIVVGRRVLVWLSDRDPDPPNHPLILDFPTGWN